MKNFVFASLFLVSVAMIAIGSGIRFDNPEPSESVGRGIVKAFASTTAETFERAAEKESLDEMDQVLATGAEISGPLAFEPVIEKLKTFADDDTEGPREYLREVAKGVRGE